jgi:hypothetical protein
MPAIPNYPTSKQEKEGKVRTQFSNADMPLSKIVAEQLSHHQQKN